MPPTIRLATPDDAAQVQVIYAPYCHTPISFESEPPSVEEVQTIPAYGGLDPAWAREMPNYIKPDGLHVPPGCFFAMGDNRDNSLDSRFWGFVPDENVVGEPLFVYWSYDAPTPDWTADSLTDRLRFDASIIKNFLSKTRWSRTGKVF